MQHGPRRASPPPQTRLFSFVLGVAVPSAEVPLAGLPDWASPKQSLPAARLAEPPVQRQRQEVPPELTLCLLSPERRRRLLLRGDPSSCQATLSWTTQRTDFHSPGERTDPLPICHVSARSATLNTTSGLR